jgi:hypothetical protein
MGKLTAGHLLIEATPCTPPLPAAALAEVTACTEAAATTGSGMNAGEARNIEIRGGQKIPAGEARTEC